MVTVVNSFYMSRIDYYVAYIEISIVVKEEIFISKNTTII